MTTKSGWLATAGRAWKAFACVAGAALVVEAAEPDSPRKDPVEAERLNFVDSGRDIRRATGAKEGEPAPSTILTVAVSPDGSTLAIGGEDPVITLRDASTNVLKASLAGHFEPLTCLAWSPDGKVLASGGFDKSVRLWDVGTATERTSLLGHDGWVYALAFSGDGKTLASAGQDGAVKLWDVEGAREIGLLQGPRVPIRSLAMTIDGKTVATGGADRIIRLWDVAGRKVIRELVGHRGTVRGLAFNADGKTLASAGEDHLVKLWDVESGRLRENLRGHTDMILALAFSPRGTGLASGGYDSSVRLWDAQAGMPIDTIRGHTEGVTALAFNPKTGALVTAGFDRGLKVWTNSKASGTLIRTVAIPKTRGIGAILSPDGKTIVTIGGDQVAKFEDAISGATLGKIEGNGAPRLQARLSADGRVLLTFTNARKLQVWDTKTFRLLGSYGKGGTGTSWAVLSKDGTKVAVAGEGNRVDLLDVPSSPVAGSEGGRELSLIRTLMEPQARSIEALAFDPAGRVLAVLLLSDEYRTSPGAATIDGIFAIQISDAKVLAKLEPGSAATFPHIAFSPDGKTLAALMSNASNPDPANAPGSLFQFWDCATWKITGSINIQNRGAAGVFGYTPDGQRLFAVDPRGMLRFWDAETRTPLGTLKAHNAATSGISFSRDGKTFLTSLTGGNEGQAKLWKMAMDDSIIVWKFPAALQTRFAPDGKTFAVATDDGIVRIVNHSKRRVELAFPKQKSRVWGVAYSPDGKSVVAVGGDWEKHDDTGFAQVFQTAGGQAGVKLEGIDKLVFSVAWSPDGKQIATGGWGPEIRFWNAETGKAEGALGGHTNSVRRVAYAPDGKSLASAGFDGTVRIWNISGKVPTEARSTIAAHPGGVNDLAFSKDGTRLVTCGKSSGTPASGDLAVFEVATGKELLQRSGAHKDQILSVAIAADGKTIATGGGDFANSSELKLWDAQTLGPSGNLTSHELWVEGVTFSPDGSRLVSVGGVAGKNGEVRMWNVENVLKEMRDGTNSRGTEDSRPRPSR